MMVYEYPVYPENNIAAPSPVLAKALHEDSNLELEWLWVAHRVPTIEEQHYCLKRALYINPNSKPARSALRNLLNQQSPEVKHKQQFENWKSPLIAFVTLLSARNG